MATTPSPSFMVTSSHVDPCLVPAFMTPRKPFGFSSRPMFEQGASEPVLPSFPAKLPSLEGLLRRIHNETTPAFEPASSEFVHTSQMPSLRSIINPSVVKTILPPSPSSIEALSASHFHESRAWEESSQSDASSEYIGSPSRAVARSQGVAPQRSRASKYCKIEGCQRVSQRNNLCHSHGGKRLCKEDGCSSKDRGNGFCIKHGGGKICSIGGCEKKARRKGLCTQHFRVCDHLASPAMISA